jgi:ribonuclease J
VPGVDFVIPNFDYLKENKNRIKAYIITHAHDDKMLALPYIYAECPAKIVTTRFTARIIELATKGLGIDMKYNFEYVEGNCTKVIGLNKINLCQVTHSMPYSFGCSIHTDQGQIVYTSDYILDWSISDENFRMDTNALLSHSRDNVLLVLSDSNNAHISGHNSPNYRITSKISKFFEDQEGRIYISLYSQNYMNIIEVLKLCIKLNKTVIFSRKRDEVQVMNLVNEFNLLEGRPKIEQIENIHRIKSSNTVIIIMNTGEHLFNEIITITSGTMDQKPISFEERDLFIFACPSVHATDIIATKALDEIYKTGMQVVQFSRKDIYSPHACEEDIKAMINIFQPKYYMPVDGDFRALLTNGKIAISLKKYNYSNVFVLDNGMILNIENGIAKVDYKEKINTGDVFIDGLDVGNIGNNVIEERNKISNDGVVVMGITVSSKKQEVIGKPDVQMRGFVFLKESENVLKEITNIFLDQVRIYLTGYYDEPMSIEDKIVERCTRFVRRETGKSPIIIPKIIDVDKQ